jgi:hypothetical protein
MRFLSAMRPRVEALWPQKILLQMSSARVALSQPRWENIRPVELIELECWAWGGSGCARRSPSGCDEPHELVDHDRDT